jgi:hypothetical protein
MKHKSLKLKILKRYRGKERIVSELKARER